MVLLQAEERTEEKQSTVRQMRKEGNIPAVLYGKNIRSKAIFVNASDFMQTIRQTGRNGLITMRVNGKEHPVMLHDIQRDPVRKEIIHADFQVVDMKREIEVAVNVLLVGEAAGVKSGGVLQQPLHELSVRALPTDIPAAIKVDVSNLEIGQTITVGDIETNGKYEINHEPTEVVASILPPKQEEEIDSGEKQEEAQPETSEERETTAE